MHVRNYNGKSLEVLAGLFTLAEFINQSEEEPSAVNCSYVRSFIDEKW